MRWGRSVFLLAATVTAMAANADELHLRDGTVIVGAYVGGTQKEIYFQHTAAGSDMYPLFMVESVKFNAMPTLAPGTSLKSTPKSMPRPAMLQDAAAPGSAAPINLAARIKLEFALFLPPPLTVQLAHPAH
jgi:hypothetical protein